MKQCARIAREVRSRKFAGSSKFFISAGGTNSRTIHHLEFPALKQEISTGRRGHAALLSNEFGGTLQQSQIAVHRVMPTALNPGGDYSFTLCLAFTALFTCRTRTLPLWTSTRHRVDARE